MHESDCSVCPCWTATIPHCADLPLPLTRRKAAQADCDAYRAAGRDRATMDDMWSAILCMDRTKRAAQDAYERLLVDNRTHHRLLRVRRQSHSDVGERLLLMRRLCTTSVDRRKRGCRLPSFDLHIPHTRPSYSPTVVRLPTVHPVLFLPMALDECHNDATNFFPHWPRQMYASFLEEECLALDAATRSYRRAEEEEERSKNEAEEEEGRDEGIMRRVHEETDGVVVATLDGNITFANECMTRVFG